MVDLKLSFEGQQARVTLPRLPTPSRDILVALFQKAFNVDTSTSINKIGYFDEDGDKIVLSDDDEVQDYWKANADDDDNAPPLRFFVKAAKSVAETPSAAPVPDPEDPVLEEATESTPFGEQSAEPTAPAPTADSVRDAFADFMRSAETGSPTGIFSSLADLVQQASRLAATQGENAGLNLGETANDVRMGVESFLGGLFRGLNLGGQGAAAPPSSAPRRDRAGPSASRGHHNRAYHFHGYRPEYGPHFYSRFGDEFDPYEFEYDPDDQPFRPFEFDPHQFHHHHSRHGHPFMGRGGRGGFRGRRGFPFASAETNAGRTQTERPQSRREYW